jgi:hypothetical protein
MGISEKALGDWSLLITPADINIRSVIDPSHYIDRTALS